MQQLELQRGDIERQELQQHPKANRKIMLEAHTVCYVLQRRRRKTVGLRIGEHGLEVAAPNRATLIEIERIVRSKAAWVIRHLKTGAQRAYMAQQQRPIWQDGVDIPYQNGRLQIRLAGADSDIACLPIQPHRLRQIVQSAQLHKLDALSQTQTPIAHVLYLPLPKNIDADTVSALVKAWIQQQAVTIFTARLDYFATVLGVQYKRLKISNAKTRWGSASSRGTICLHWRLLQMPSMVLDYVVVHELAHLHEMNHSKRFWAWVEKVLPDYKKGSCC